MKFYDNGFSKLLPCADHCIAPSMKNTLFCISYELKVHWPQCKSRPHIIYEYNLFRILNVVELVSIVVDVLILSSFFYEELLVIR